MKSWFLILVLLGFPGEASAQSAVDYRLDVTRQANAQQCPDTGGLRDLVEAERGPHKQATGDAFQFNVEFLRDAKFYAIIQVVGEQQRHRILRDDGETCDTLARSVATSIAMALEPQIVEAPRQVAAPAVRNMEVPRPARHDAPVRRVSKPRSSRWTLGAGPGFSYEVVPGLAVGAGGTVAVDTTRSLRLGVQATLWPYASTEVGTTTVRSTAISVAPQGCLHVPVDKRILSLACVTLPVTYLSIGGSGLARNHTDQTLSLALGASIQGQVHLVENMFLGLELGGILRPYEQRILVDSTMVHEFSTVAITSLITASVQF